MFLECSWPCPGGTRYLCALMAKAVNRVGCGNRSHEPYQSSMVPYPIIGCSRGGISASTIWKIHLGSYLMIFTGLMA